jgi:hypothetical protein
MIHTVELGEEKIIWVWWYTFIIPAGGLRVQGQTGLHSKTLSQKKKVIIVTKP